MELPNERTELSRHRLKRAYLRLKAGSHKLKLADLRLKPGKQRMKLADLSLNPGSNSMEPTGLSLSSPRRRLKRPNEEKPQNETQESQPVAPLPQTETSNNQNWPRKYKAPAIASKTETSGTKADALFSWSSIWKELLSLMLVLLRHQQCQVRLKPLPLIPCGGSRSESN